MSEQKPISCEGVKDFIQEYVEGILEPEKTIEIENHLKVCNSCTKLLETSENSLLFSKENSNKLNVNKLELNLAMNVTSRLIIICALILVAGYMLIIALPQTFLLNKVRVRSTMITNAMSDIVQFTKPGGIDLYGWRGKLGLFDEIDNVDYQQPLIGGGYEKGSLNLATPLYVGKYNWQIKSERSDDGGYIDFYFPCQRDEGSVNFQWNKLKNVEKSTESQIALHFVKPMTMEEMDSLISKSHDPFVSKTDIWFAIDTSKLNINRNGYRNMMFLRACWGFPLDTRPSMNPYQFGNSGYGKRYDNLRPVTQAVEEYRDEMNNFVKSAASLKDFEFLNDLKKVNELAQSDKLRIIGVILKAQTSKLLKLKSEKSIASIDIVKVDFDYYSINLGS